MSTIAPTMEYNSAPFVTKGLIPKPPWISTHMYMVKTNLYVTLAVNRSPSRAGWSNINLPIKTCVFSV